MLYEFAINAGIKKATKIALKHYLDLSNSDPKRYGIYLRGWLNRAMEALT
jgi:hypothetical protein